MDRPRTLAGTAVCQRMTSSPANGVFWEDVPTFVFARTISSALRLWHVALPNSNLVWVAMGGNMARFMKSILSGHHTLADCCVSWATVCPYCRPDEPTFPNMAYSGIQCRKLTGYSLVVS